MKVRESISTATIVLLMTLTVWVIADRSVLRASPEMMVTVEVGSADPQYRLKVIEPDAGSGSAPQILVRFRGPGRAIDALTARHRQNPVSFRHIVRQQQLTGDSGEIVIPIRSGFSYLAEEQAVSLDYSRTPVEQQPVENVRVRYEREERLTDIPVRFADEDLAQLGEDAAIQPVTVTATVLNSQRDEISSRGPLLAHPQLDFRSLPRGRFERTVPLRSNMPDLDITFNPSHVTVRSQLAVREQTRELKDVRVMVEAPPELLNQYSVELLEDQVSVQIKGPKVEVDELSAQSVTASLVLTDNDKPGPLQPRSLIVRFPPGSNVVLDQAQPPFANFVLREKTPPPEPPN